MPRRHASTRAVPNGLSCTCRGGYRLKQISGVTVSTPQFLVDTHVIKSRRSVERYLDVVLGRGALPLELLEGLVRDWIQSQAVRCLHTGFRWLRQYHADSGQLRDPRLPAPITDDIEKG